MGIRNSSPFKPLFETLREEVRENLKDEEGKQENNYYQPQFVDILTNQYLPLVSLWSGIMLQTEGKTRDTNAHVESWMNTLKNYILLKKGPIRIGLFAQKEFSIVKGRLKEYVADAKLQNTPRKTNTDRKNEYKKKEEERNGDQTMSEELTESDDDVIKPKIRRKRNHEQREEAEEEWGKKRQRMNKSKSSNYKPSFEVPEPDLERRKKKNIGKRTPKKGRIYKGLQNTDNTCWLNSSLQALRSFSTFKLQARDEINVETRSALESLNQRTEPELSSLKDLLESKLGLVIGEYHDAADYVGHVLTHEPVKLEVVSEFTCLTCREVHTTRDAQKYLIAEMPGRDRFNVLDVIATHCEPQVMEEGNEVCCSVCANSTRQVVRLKINTEESDVLVIQLKRYKHTDTKSQRTQKINHQLYLNRVLTVATRHSVDYFRLRAVQMFPILLMDVKLLHLMIPKYITTNTHIYRLTHCREMHTYCTTKR
ncbi:uncharacterized protein LOC132760382 [Ruditapes philippinarum]|uniref:uncharacterized protein LOC132760382 n=1 Tax=Ruditapes philippinarum TaxID=129788 RepID=UPI00295A5713|nr:uncharacterized protein LOC132760382 [Ruditapes philippinarum]